MELIRRFLNDREEARKALQSKDTVELYLALWSIGFYNTEEIQALVPGIIKDSLKYQVQTLLYFTLYAILRHEPPHPVKMLLKNGITNRR